jgi:6-pyruvoyltetrahydropterin/6-carboxytetrahydropterin synthase
MYELRVKSHFDAAHYIKDYSGKCQRMHGHRWGVQVCLVGSKLDKMGILVDFSVVKELLKSRTDFLDHYVINDQFGEDNVTAESLARWFYESLRLDLRDKCSLPMQLESVSISESPECIVTYKDTGE